MLSLGTCWCLFVSHEKEMENKLSGASVSLMANLNKGKTKLN